MSDPQRFLPARVLALLGAGLLAGAAAAEGLPPAVEAALERVKLPREAISLVVADAEGRAAPRLLHRAQVPMNPASVMKLVTTYAALDLLGPAYTWSTPVYIEGAVRDGTLYGTLTIRGLGDPKLVLERMWLLLRRVQGLGVRHIHGDIVLDHSAFSVPDTDPGGFDGEPLRPYNVAPDALMLNYKSVVMTFVPDRTANIAQVQFDPPLAGVTVPTTVPLSAGECGDYRATLRADFSDPARVRFAGTYPASCQEKVWPVAYVDPRSYGVRAIEGLWQAMGGQLTGSVRDGRLGAPLGGAPVPVFELVSPSLAEVIRDINKFSNNVMAQQLFLTLGLTQRPAGSATAPGSMDAAREVIRRWWPERVGTGLEPPVMDNGSGLSRSERISAQGLARMLQVAYLSPQMPELMSSLPITGVDGTMRRNRSRAAGNAHLKTGSLRDVAALAGYVHGASGRRYVLVALINHPNAGAGRPVLDALLEWTQRDP
jgi:D-alanyl-D-alanine carboxypeptidase/D-alanyl-D-alanine-endopeptidase (penicillin-binding protein 4)